MYIHQVPRGTDFTFTYDDETVIEGLFDGNIDHLQFYIVSPEISRNIEELKELEPEVTFIINDTSYKFKAMLVRISEKKEAIHDALEFKVISPIKDTPLRKNFRLKITLKVRIHKYTDDYTKMNADGWICDAVSDDMSKNGIRLFTDTAIESPLGTIYTLEFTLKQGSIYMVPAKLVRNVTNTTTRSYNYDIGFSFDFSEMNEKHERLLMDILEHKIKNRV
ncbi:MAG: PilZ domain-containing protein [Defluviitaleaceae bacterium]|nr:PilZ domain-containing protein [Defluviitaleaceae bacterium]